MSNQTMSNQTDEHALFNAKAVAWVSTRILRPRNLTLLVTYLMEAAAVHFPSYSGLEKKDAVLGALENLLEMPVDNARIVGRDQVEVAVNKLVDSWITFGIDAHKHRFTFRTQRLAAAPGVPEPMVTNGSAIASIASVAEEWFKDRKVTAANVVMGIAAIMQAAGQFFQGDGQTKKDFVLTVVREIVRRETTDLVEEDRDAVLLAIDTFAPAIIDFGIDMATGNFDFKGLVEQIKDVARALCWCCPPPEEKETSEKETSEEVSI